MRGEHAFGNRHADGIGDALAERAGGGLDASGNEILRMPRRLRLEMTEILQLLDRQVVAAQMQQRVEQHQAVPVRHDEAVAILQLRIGRVVDKKVVTQERSEERRVGTACVKTGRSWRSAEL